MLDDELSCLQYMYIQAPDTVNVSHQARIILFLSPCGNCAEFSCIHLSSTVGTLPSLAHETSYIPGRRWGRTPHSVSLIELVQLSKKWYLIMLL